MSYAGDTKVSGIDATSVDPAGAESPKYLPESEADLDDNYNLYQQQVGQQLDPNEAKAVLRKIDFRVLPVLIIIYLLQYLDKNGINYASAYGLEEGTGLEGQVRDIVLHDSVAALLTLLRCAGLQLAFKHLLFWVSDCPISLWISPTTIPHSEGPRKRNTCLGYRPHHYSCLSQLRGHCQQSISPWISRGFSQPVSDELGS